MATAAPESATVRPACRTASTAASSTAAPASRDSRKRLTVRSA